MIHLFLSFFKTKAQLQLEILFLRKQLEILSRSKKKAQINSWDKLFFSTIISFFNNWKEYLIIIKPETIIRWHRKRFYQHLMKKRKNDAGRPRASKKVIELIKQIANDNPMWGIPRIHGEMLKLGYDISQATVWRYVPKKNGSTSGQRWKTFLKNHASEIISIDYFSVPTINFKILHVLVFLSHERRKIIHFNVTSNPTSEWAVQQLRNALHNSDIPKYLIRDRDCRFGKLFKQSVTNFGINEIVTAYRSP
jgi:putative transposase